MGWLQCPHSSPPSAAACLGHSPASSCPLPGQPGPSPHVPGHFYSATDCYHCPAAKVLNLWGHGQIVPVCAHSIARSSAQGRTSVPDQTPMGSNLWAHLVPHIQPIGPQRYTSNPRQCLTMVFLLYTLLTVAVQSKSTKVTLSTSTCKYFLSTFMKAKHANKTMTLQGSRSGTLWPR